MFLAIGLGSAAIPADETVRFVWAALTGGTVTAQEVPAHQIVWQIRTPRVLLAAVVGAVLSAVGVAMQCRSPDTRLLEDVQPIDSAKRTMQWPILAALDCCRCTAAPSTRATKA